VTCPARGVNGVHVSGFPLLQGRRWCYPPSLQDELPDDYPQMCDLIQSLCNPQRDSHRLWRRRLSELGLERACDKVVADSDRLVELFLRLGRADVEMIQFSFVDRLGHVFEMSGRVERFCYDLVGRLVRRLIDQAPAESTVIVSDHGFRGQTHTSHGCLGLSGPLRQAVKVPKDYTPSVLDVAPTICGFFGVVHDCEGNDLTSDGNYTTRHVPDEQREKQELLKRLTDLGYF